MTKSQLNAIARATGEDVETIQQRGFSLVSVFPEDVYEPDSIELPDPQVVDWDSPFVGTTQSFYDSYC